MCLSKDGEKGFLISCCSGGFADDLGSLLSRADDVDKFIGIQDVKEIPAFLSLLLEKVK